MLYCSFVGSYKLLLYSTHILMCAILGPSYCKYGVVATAYIDNIHHYITLRHQSTKCLRSTKHGSKALIPLPFYNSCVCHCTALFVLTVAVNQSVSTCEWITVCDTSFDVLYESVLTVWHPKEKGVALSLAHTTQVIKQLEKERLVKLYCTMTTTGIYFTIIFMYCICNYYLLCIFLMVSVNIWVSGSGTFTINSDTVRSV